MFLEPALSGITQTQAAAVTEFCLRVFLSKSMTVAAAPTPTIQEVQSQMSAAANAPQAAVAAHLERYPRQQQQQQQTAMTAAAMATGIPAVMAAHGTPAANPDDDPFSDLELTGDEAEAARANAEEKGEIFAKRIKVRKSYKIRHVAAANSKNHGAKHTE